MWQPVHPWCTVYRLSSCTFHASYVEDVREWLRFYTHRYGDQAILAPTGANDPTFRVLLLATKKADQFRCCPVTIPPSRTQSSWFDRRWGLLRPASPTVWSELIAKDSLDRERVEYFGFRRVLSLQKVAVSAQRSSYWDVLWDHLRCLDVQASGREDGLIAHYQALIKGLYLKWVSAQPRAPVEDAPRLFVDFMWTQPLLDSLYECAHALVDLGVLSPECTVAFVLAFAAMEAELQLCATFYVEHAAVRTALIRQVFPGRAASCFSVYTKFTRGAAFYVPLSMEESRQSRWRRVLTDAGLRLASDLFPVEMADVCESECLSVQAADDAFARVKKCAVCRSRRCYLVRYADGLVEPRRTPPAPCEGART